MQLRAGWLLVYRLLLSFLLASLFAGQGLAQSPTPLSELTIRLWPEYDRPQLLVIFRGTVAEGISLPAPVSFTLPAGVQTLYAVAYLDETNGTLINIEDYNLTASAGGKVLSFATPGRQFQFEYYTGAMFLTNGVQRQISFLFTASADIARLTVELQQPTAAQAFASTPPPSATQKGPSGLPIATYDAGPIAAGASYSLRASYTRSTNTPSAGVDIPAAPQVPPVEVGGRTLSAAEDWLMGNLGLILVAAGLLLLSGALVYWLWSRRTMVVAVPPCRSPAPRKRPRAAPRPARQAAADQARATYCHRCGAPFRDDEARFCYACGAERRSD